MKVQPQELTVCLRSDIRHLFQVTGMNESSEVKALVRSASNVSGRSIKRKLQHRHAAILYSTWMETCGCRILSDWMKTNTTWGRNGRMHLGWVHRCMDCDMIRKPGYQSWEGLTVSQNRAKTLCITLWGKAKGDRETGGCARRSDDG